MDANSADHDSAVAQLLIKVDADAVHLLTMMLHSADWMGNGDVEHVARY